MRKKLAWVALLVLAVTSLASADSTIQFLSTGGNSYNGVASYPYYGKVDGVPTTFMCLEDFLHVTAGESWAAIGVHPTTLVQMEEAWLFLRAGNGSDSDYQGAIWWLTDNSEPLTVGAQTLVNTVLAQNLNPSDFTGVTIWIPDLNDQTGWTDGQPQSFMSTPEPTTLLALGTGVLGIAMRLRRKV